MYRRVKIGVVFFIAAAGIIAAFFISPIAQSPEYFNFAAGKTLWGVPNFGDVLSSVLFSVVGVFGALALRTHWRDRSRFIDVREIISFAVAFTGLILLGPGSAYFHWTPSNETLVWDRLPMTLVFMAFFAVIIAERIHLKAGFYLLPFLLLAGVASVVYWDVAESAGRGDLRPYGLVQFLPALIIPIIFILFPPRYSGGRYLIGMIAGYAAAKVLEFYDGQVHDLTGHFISGHTLKHLAASLAAFGLVKYIHERRKV